MPVDKADSDEGKYCCLKHKTDVSDLPPGYDECPLCREERRQHQAQIERSIRNKRVEPY